MLPDVDRIGEHIRIIRQNTVSPISLMGIGINNHNLDSRAIDLQIPNRNSDVIENTISFTTVLERMVSSSSENSCHSILKSGMTSLTGRFHFSRAPMIKLRGHGKSEKYLLFPVQLPVVNFGEVVMIVNPPQNMAISLIHFDNIFSFHDTTTH